MSSGTESVRSSPGISRFRRPRNGSSDWAASPSRPTRSGSGPVSARPRSQRPGSRHTRRATAGRYDGETSARERWPANGSSERRGAATVTFSMKSRRRSPRSTPARCAWTMYFSSSPRAGHRRRGWTAAPWPPSGTCRRPSASGSSAGCEGSRSQMFFDPRDVLLDRGLRLLWIGGRGKAHHEQCLAARVDDEVLVRLGMDHDGLDRILRFIGDGHRGADQDGEHRPEGIHVDAAGKAPPEIRSPPGNKHRLLHTLVLLDFVEKGLEGGRVDHDRGSSPADMDRERDDTFPA